MGRNEQEQGGYLLNSFRAKENKRLRLIHQGRERPDGTFDPGEAQWGEEFNIQLQQMKDSGFIPKRGAIIGTGDYPFLAIAAAKMFPEATVDVYELDPQKVAEAEKNAQEQLGDDAKRIHFIAGDMQETMQGVEPYEWVDVGLVLQHVSKEIMSGMLHTMIGHTKKGGRITVREVVGEYWQVTPKDEGFDARTPEDPYRRRREIWADPEIQALVTARSAVIADMIELGYRSRGAELFMSAEDLAKRILDLSKPAENMSPRLKLLPVSRLKLAKITPGSVEAELVEQIIDINEDALEKRLYTMRWRGQDTTKLQARLSSFRHNRAVYINGINNPDSLTEYFYPGHVSQTWEVV